MRDIVPFEGLGANSRKAIVKVVCNTASFQPKLARPMSFLMKWVFLSLATLSLVVTSVQAKEYQVCTFDFPNIQSKDGTGPQPGRQLFEEITRRVSAKTGDRFTLNWAPPKRCMAFMGTEFDILWAYVAIDDFETAKEVGYSEIGISSFPVMMGGNYIFTREDSPKLNSVKDLEGEIVGAQLGLALPAGVRENINIELHEVRTYDQAAQMLSNGRLTAILVQTGAIPNLKEKDLLKSLHHGRVLEFWGAGFVFQLNREGALLDARFSNVLLEMVIDGTYRDLYEGAPYYIPYNKAQ